jgi:hypothetical protein
MVLFYKQKDQSSLKIVELFKSLAEKMYGVAKVGAIECKEELEMCEEFSITKIPTIMVFTELSTDKGEVYRDKLEVNGMQNFISSKMTNFVSEVTLQNFQEFMGQDP